MENLTANIGKNIKALRKQHGWTQVELAKKIDCSQELITFYERNIKKPSAEKIALLADALDVTTNDLYGINGAGHKRISATKPKNPKLWKRFEQIENLPSSEKSAVVKMLDAMIDRNKKK
jgi:transcriptional regulator with XRE-family HTH domain